MRTTPPPVKRRGARGLPLLAGALAAAVLGAAVAWLTEATPTPAADALLQPGQPVAAAAAPPAASR